jgi:hypothetical protein
MPKCKMCPKPGEYHVQLRVYHAHLLDPNKERPVYLMLEAVCADHQKEIKLEYILDSIDLRKRIEAQFFLGKPKPDWRRSELRWVAVNSEEALAAFRGINQRLRDNLGDIEELLRSRM